jgi:hypothetical protein
MALIGIAAQVMMFLLKKYPVEKLDADAVVAAEIEKARAGRNTQA